MKTIFILLLSVITSTCLIGQNVLSFRTQEKKDTYKIYVLTDTIAIKNNINQLQAKVELINHKIKTIRSIRDDSIRINLHTENISELQNQIDDLEMGIDSLKRNIDSLTKKLTELEKKYYEDTSDIGKSDFQWLFRGGKNQTISRDFWTDLGEPRKNLMLSLSLGDLGGTLFTEVIADYLGPLRFSLSTAITSVKKSTSDSSNNTQAPSAGAEKKDNKDALQSLLNGSGGNAILRAMLPLIFWSNRLDKNNPGKNTRYIGLYFSNKVSGSIPELNRSVDKPSGLLDASFETQFGILTENKTFGIEGFISIGAFYGSSDLMDKLTREGFRNMCFYSQGCIKITIKEELQIYLNFPISLGAGRNFALDNTPYSFSLSTFIDKKEEKK